MRNVVAGLNYDGSTAWAIDSNNDLALKLPLSFDPGNDYVIYDDLSFRVLDAHRGILRTSVWHAPGSTNDVLHDFLSIVDLVDGSLTNTVSLGFQPVADLDVVVATPRYALVYTTAIAGDDFAHTMHIIDTDDLSISTLSDTTILTTSPERLDSVWAMTVDENIAIVHHMLRGSGEVITGAYDLSTGEILWEKDLSEIVSTIQVFPETVDIVNGVIYINRAVGGTLWVDIISTTDGSTVASVETDYSGSNSYLRSLRPLLLSHGGITGILILDGDTATANVIAPDGTKTTIPTNPSIIEALTYLGASKPGGRYAVPAANLQDKSGVHFIPIVWQQGSAN